MEINKIYQGDCLIKLKELEDNSVDSIVTDPPYELGFMGKSWDNTGIANNKEMWAECLRVLKPGGHLLSFSGTRTYHRMASAIEDAGFEIRDMIEWVYGSGFPKSLAIGKAINKLETKEWLNIGNGIDKFINNKDLLTLWKNNLNNVKIVERILEKNPTEIGICMLKKDSVQENVVENTNQTSYDLIVSFVEKNLNEVQVIDTKINTVLQNVEAEIKQLQNPVKSVELFSQNQNHKYWNIFTVECDVKELLKEKTNLTIKVEEALMTLRGNKQYSEKEITNAICVALTEGLKHTILNQSKTFQNLDTIQQMECVSATNVIITKSIMDNLILNTVNIAKEIAVDKLQGNEREVVGKEKGAGTTGDNQVGNQTFVAKNQYEDGTHDVTKGTSEWEGWGTALKPAHEPICMARKPLAEKTVAENVLKYGTGGINIDESRIPTDDNRNREQKDGPLPSKYGFNSNSMGNRFIELSSLGRFPANLIHDNSEEVRECFPDVKSGGSSKQSIRTKTNDSFLGTGFGGKEIQSDISPSSGNASRFFKSIIYQAKASKGERNAGLDVIEVGNKRPQGEAFGDGSAITEHSERKGNFHPTVKPIALMEYLIKMVTPKGGIVLDPFAGSGTTGVACKNLNINYILIEKEPEYCKIANERLTKLNNGNDGIPPSPKGKGILPTIT